MLVLENALRYWWIIALCIVLGGLGGLLTYSRHPAIYEATAEFAISIDYVGTGPLTQYDEDMALGVAGNIFVSNEILQTLVDQATSEGINIMLDDLEEYVFLERRFDAWTLRVRHPDPHTAERLAQIWLTQGETALKQRYEHAMQAYSLERYIQAQLVCLEKAGVSEPTSDPCSRVNFTEIQLNLRDAGAALYQEKLASQGLFTGLTLGPFNLPVGSAQPVSAGRNQFVFLGSLLGLLLGIVLIESGASKIRRTKS